MMCAFFHSIVDLIPLSTLRTGTFSLLTQTGDYENMSIVKGMAGDLLTEQAEQTTADLFTFKINVRRGPLFELNSN